MSGKIHPLEALIHFVGGALWLNLVFLPQGGATAQLAPRTSNRPIGTLDVSLMVLYIPILMSIESPFSHLTFSLQSTLVDKIYTHRLSLGHLSLHPQNEWGCLIIHDILKPGKLTSVQGIMGKIHSGCIISTKAVTVRISALASTTRKYRAPTNT